MTSRHMILAAALLLPIAASAAPADKTKKLVDAFKAIKAPPSGAKLSAADAAANQKQWPVIDGYFDFDAFSTGCIGPNASKMRPEQQKEFQTRQIDIIRRSGYVNAGELFNKAETKDTKVTEKDGVTTVTITMFMAKEDLTIELGFVYGKGEKVIDLVIDGDALTKDYQNQVGKIITKSGVPELLKKLADRQAKIDK